MMFSLDPVSAMAAILAPFTEPTGPRLSLTRVADGLYSEILEAKGFATVAGCAGSLLVIVLLRKSGRDSRKSFIDSSRARNLLLVFVSISFLVLLSLRPLSAARSVQVSRRVA